MDGNHKLIRWRLVVHGTIDGYSRLITFLHCSSNRASTVLDCFTQAVHEYGTPSRVRTDHGGENVRVWDYMEEEREEIHILQDEVYTTLGLSVCGVMFIHQFCQHTRWYSQSSKKKVG